MPTSQPCWRGHPVTPENTDRNGCCRQCAREAYARHKAKVRARSTGRYGKPHQPALVRHVDYADRFGDEG